MHRHLRTILTVLALSGAVFLVGCEDGGSSETKTPVVSDPYLRDGNPAAAFEVVENDKKNAVFTIAFTINNDYNASWQSLDSNSYEFMISDKNNLENSHDYLEEVNPFKGEYYSTSTSTTLACRPANAREFLCTDSAADENVTLPRTTTLYLYKLHISWKLEFGSDDTKLVRNVNYRRVGTITSNGILE